MWDIIGQERAVALLRSGLKAGSLSHAYIFTGPAHTGKMTLALKLAQALNCEGDEPPCGECRPCRRIASGQHSDVQIVGLTSTDDSAESRQRTEIGIGQIRDVQHSASLPPFEGKCRVYVIEDAELLSIEAANSLLKTLEEPTGNVVFVLLAVHRQMLPETVVSRCQPVELRPLSLAEIEIELVENRGVTEEKATLLAGLSHGCFGWAVTAADDDSVLTQREEQLEKMLDAIEGGIEERFAYASQLASQFALSRASVQGRLDLWLDWWRDLLLVKAGSEDNVINADRLEQLVAMAASFSLRGIKEYIESIRLAGDNLRRNANPQLALEVLMLDIPERKVSGGVRAAV